MSRICMNGWCLLLTIAIQFCLPTHSMIDSKNTDLKIRRSPLEDTAEERSFAIELCFVFGCKCNNDDLNQVTEVTCDCRSQGGVNNGQKTAIKLADRVKYPPKLKTLRISHCYSLEIGSTSKRIGLSELHLSELLIESIEWLSLSPAALKRITNLTLKNVSLFSFEKRVDHLQAFDELDADNVLIHNVTFNNDPKFMADFRPQLIRKKLEIDSSRISNRMPILINREPADNLTVTFRNCHIDEMISTIHANRIEMIGNHFNFDNQSNSCPRADFDEKDFSSAIDCAPPEKMIELKYKILDMTKNTLQNKIVPDIHQNVTQMADIEVDFEPGVTDLKMGEIWIKFFEFIPNSNSTSNKRTVAPCKEITPGKNYPRHRRVSCPNMEKVIEYVSQQIHHRSNEHFKSGQSGINLYSIWLPSFYTMFLAAVHLVGALKF